MGDEEHRERFPEPPDETDPSVKFARYIVTWLPMSVTMGSADNMTREQLEAAKASGVLVLSKAELLSEWRKRYLADQRAT